MSKFLKKISTTLFEYLYGIVFSRWILNCILLLILSWFYYKYTRNQIQIDNLLIANSIPTRPNLSRIWEFTAFFSVMSYTISYFYQFELPKLKLILFCCALFWLIFSIIICLPFLIQIIKI